MVSFFRPRAGLLPALLVLLLCPAASFPQSSRHSGSADDSWSNRFAVPGLNHYQSLLPTSPGRICIVKAGGYFVLPNDDGTFGNYLLGSWDGQGWNVEGPGEFDIGQYVLALEVMGTDTYIGGNFTRIGDDTIAYVARWDGSAWWPLSAGVNGQVRALATDGNLRLYVGGSFGLADGNQAHNIVRWDGDHWTMLTNQSNSNEGVNGQVWDIAVGNSRVYVAGEHQYAAGLFSPWVASWNWTVPAWYAFGGGPGSFSSQVEVSDITGEVFAGGGYYSTFANPFIVRWDGSAWSDLGAGSSTTSITVLEALNNGELISNGHFFGSGSDLQLAKWDGVSQWDSLGSVSNININAVAAKSSDDIYVSVASGNFPWLIHNGLMRWNGSAWTGLGEGIGDFWSFAPGGVYALEEFGGEVYAGGVYANAGWKPIRALARWNDTSWADVGGSDFSPNATVYTLKRIGASLYAGGYFSTIGGDSMQCIARWDGSDWTALGRGIQGHAPPGGVRAIESVGGTIYAGGGFNYTGDGVKSHGISRWNGVTWAPLGGGIDGSAQALATDGVNLFVGGGFSTLEGGAIPASCVALWDGDSWSAVGVGVTAGSSASVDALAYGNGKLYAGGNFSGMGGVPASNIAMWDGSAWSAMGPGLPGRVYALWLNGADLYAGGQFNGSAGNTIYGIAKWNGSDWVPLGKGVHKNINFPATPTVYSLLGTGDGLYLGGDFTHAGNKYSNQIALWSDFTPVTAVGDPSGGVPSEFRIEQNYPNPFNPITSFRFDLPVQGHVSLKIFDLLGRQVASIVDEVLSPGAHTRAWDATGRTSGVYYYRFEAGGFTSSGKVLLVK